MGTQDNTERVLRSLHVMLSKSDTYEHDSTKVIIDRQEMIDLLTELNRCIYAMMDEYELTKEGRDRAERAFQKHGDEIIWDASRKAEDIYAASVMYTDEALSSVQDIMGAAAEAMQRIYKQMEEQLKEQYQLVRSNQTELKGQLQDLVDTEKYLKLIEARNREIQKEKNEEKTVRKKEPSIYADRQTGIRINTEMLEKMGLSMEEEVTLGEEKSEAESSFEKKEALPLNTAENQNKAVSPTEEEEDSEIEDLIRLDLDADYFKWKEEQDAAINGGSSKREQKDISEGIHKVLKSFSGGKK